MAAIKEFVLLSGERAHAASEEIWKPSQQWQQPPAVHYEVRRNGIAPLSEGGESFQAIVELWCNRPDEPMRDRSKPAIEGIATSRSVQFLAEEHIIKEGRGPVKFMSLLRRKRGIDPETFSRAWRIHHPLVVRSVSEVWDNFRGYRQNHVIPGQCRYLDGSDMPVPFDGIVEIWFASRADLTAAMMSERYREIIRPDEETFVDLPNIRMLSTEEIVVSG